MQHKEGAPASWRPALLRCFDEWRESSSFMGLVVLGYGRRPRANNTFQTRLPREAIRTARARATPTGARCPSRSPRSRPRSAARVDAPTAAMSSNAPPDPELKAKLASLVGRLTTELGIGGGRSAEGLATASVAMLSKMISPYDVTKVAQQQSQRLLTERAPDPEAFAAQYSRLKALDVREVDKYLAVVAKIVADEDLLAAVTTPPALAPSPAPADARAAATTPAPIPASSSPATSSDRFDLSSARAVSDDDAGGRAADADVSALPVDGFSFSTNPLASDETFRGDDASASRGGTPARADGLRRLGDLSLVDPASPDAADDDDRDMMCGGERLRASVPELPDWCGARPFLTGAHLGNDLRGESDDRSTKPISEYSTACQELLLVDDLLYAMMGAEGRYVRAAKLPEIGRGFSSSSGSSPSGVVFELPAGLEPSLAALAERLLPLCSASHAVLRYVESSGTGYARGLCARAGRRDGGGARDWRTVVAQLEHQRNLGRLSLQSTWYYCQPAASAMALLATVATDVARDLRGGALLAALREASDALAGSRGGGAPREALGSRGGALRARDQAVGVRGRRRRPVRRVRDRRAAAPSQGEPRGGVQRRVLDAEVHAQATRRAPAVSPRRRRASLRSRREDPRDGQVRQRRARDGGTRR